MALIAEPLEIVGFLFLPGLILGTAQALVLRRYLPYLPRGTSGVAVIWIVGSSVGWLAGCVVFVFVRALLGLTGVPEITQDAGAVIDQFAGSVSASDQAEHVVIWTVFAVSQAAALALIVIARAGRQVVTILDRPVGARRRRGRGASRGLWLGYQLHGATAR